MRTLDDGNDPFMPDPKVLSNRQKNRTAKAGSFWCGGCDANKIGQVGKCKVCGYRENKKKRRK